MSAEAMGDAFRHSPYRGARLLVHLAIADVVNDVHGNQLWMTRDALAEKARVSRGAVDAALSELVADGWLRVVTEGGGRGKPTEYRYLVGGKPPTEEGVSEETAQPEGETAQKAGSHPLSIPREPNPSRVVFDAWRASTGKHRAVLDAKRQRLIKTRLREFSVEDLVKAVQGWEHSPYHRGENEQRKVYNDLGLILRDAEHVERFMDYAERASRAPSKPRPASRVMERCAACHHLPPDCRCPGGPS